MVEAGEEKVSGGVGVNPHKNRRSGGGVPLYESNLGEINDEDYNTNNMINMNMQGDK